MGNRRRFKSYGLQREVVHLYASVAIGATGAPTLSSTGSIGFTSITRIGAGDYDVVLREPYSEIIGFTVALLDATARDFTFHLAVRNASASGGGTFSFFCNTGALSTELPNGSTILIKVICRNVEALGG